MGPVDTAERNHCRAESLPSGITAAQVSKSTVTVFINRVNTASTVSYAPATSARNESTVTYATASSVGATVNSFTASTGGVYVTFDLTALVQSWINFCLQQ